MICDFGVSVETGPCVNVEFPVGGIEDVSDVMSLQSPFVFGSVPGLKKQNKSIYTYVYARFPAFTTSERTTEMLRG